MACKMTCSDQGLLWPLPAGEFHLSKTLVPVATENSVQLAAVDAADQQSEDLVTRFYNEVCFPWSHLARLHTQWPLIRCTPDFSLTLLQCPEF